MDEGYLFQTYLEKYGKDLLEMVVAGGAERLLCSFEVWLVEEGHLPERDGRTGEARTATS